MRKETYDEVGIKLIEPVKRGIVIFKFMMNHEPDHIVHIYRADGYEGFLDSSKDFVGYAWFHENNLPKPMMPADKYWMPHFFSRNEFAGDIWYDKVGDELKVVAHNIIEVNGLP